LEFELHPTRNPLQKQQQQKTGLTFASGTANLSGVVSVALLAMA
jgi:hypothetical protein